MLVNSIFFFNDTATTQIYTTANTLSLHDALPIYVRGNGIHEHHSDQSGLALWRSEEHTSELQSLAVISYAVFCLKKKKLQDQSIGAIVPDYNKTTMHASIVQ